MEKKKILITGFPHTGTSILKSKMGECDDVYEYPYEYYEFLPSHIVDSGEKKFLVMKTPVLPVEFRIDGPIGVATNPKNKYHNYYTILLIRNPWYVFTSIIKKGFDPLIQLDNSHWQKIEYFVTIGEYLASAKKFLEARKENYPRIFTLKYEEFFDDNQQKIKDIFDSIGLIYTENVFQTKTKDYIHWPNINYQDITEEPKEYDKWGRYRTWQINQPFQNMNGEVNIPDELDKILKESPIIKELGYSDPRLTY